MYRPARPGLVFLSLGLLLIRFSVFFLCKEHSNSFTGSGRTVGLSGHGPPLFFGRGVWPVFFVGLRIV
jgi:hypothetical protein